MKVRVSYTIDVEKIPDEIKKIFYTAETELNGAFQISQVLLSEFDKTKTSELLKKIEIIREKLVSADLSYQDCSRLVNDYENYMLNKYKYDDNESLKNVDNLEKEEEK